MTISQRFTISLIASILAAGWALPAPATELPIPPVRKVVGVAPVKKSTKHGPTRLAAAEWPPTWGWRRGGAILLVLGVGF